MTYLDLLVVGKLKDKSFEEIEKSYLKRIKNPYLKIHEVKARAENKDLEGESLLKKAYSLYQNPYLIALCENGTNFNSLSFSRWLFSQTQAQKNLVFLIAGAEGFSDDVLLKAQSTLSLSELTFPHKLARILFIEQIYRAITIKNNHPYHN